MIQLLVAAALLGLVIYAFLPADRRRAWGRKALLWGGAGFLVLMLVTGRLHWLFAVLAGLWPLAARLLPLVRAWPWLRRWLGRTPTGMKDSGNRLRARLLTLTLEDGNALTGEVHASPWRGAQLQDLSLEQLQELLRYCEARDTASASLLRAFLDRQHGAAWHGRGPQADAGPITREEACAILAVPPDADRDAIVAAHRRLMQRLHPDRGGSDYLAGRINAAKRRLLEP